MIHRLVLVLVVLGSTSVSGQVVQEATPQPKSQRLNVVAPDRSLTGRRVFDSAIVNQDAAAKRTNGFFRANRKATDPMSFDTTFDGPTMVRRLVVGGLLSTALVLVLLFFGIGKFRGERSNVSAGKMELLDTLQLAPRCCLHLVRVRDRILVVGRDAAGMQQVVPMPDLFESHLLEALPDDDRQLAADELTIRAGI